jgi:hypothetical protein
MAMMKIEIDMDELVGLMLDNKLFEEVMCELHPEFMGTLEKKLQFLKDIVRAGRTHEVWTQEELEEDRAMQLDASMRRSVNNLIYTRSIK